MQVFECQCELVHAKLKVLTNTLCIRTFIRKVTDDIVLATTFKLGSCSVEFTHWEVYNESCERKEFVQLTELLLLEFLPSSCTLPHPSPTLFSPSFPNLVLSSSLFLLTPFPLPSLFLLSSFPLPSLFLPPPHPPLFLPDGLMFLLSFSPTTFSHLFCFLLHLATSFLHSPIVLHLLSDCVTSPTLPLCLHSRGSTWE